MSVRTVLRLTLGLCVAFLLACGNPWKVIHASGNPSALKGVSAFKVAVDYEGLMIGQKSESEYVSGKDADTAASFAGDKKGMEEAFRATLAANQAGWAFGDTGAVDVRVHVQFIEPGFYVGVAKMPTSLITTVTFTKDGQLLDEIEITTVQDADMMHPASGQRMRDCAIGAANNTLAFLKKVNK